MNVSLIGIKLQTMNHNYNRKISYKGNRTMSYIKMPFLFSCKVSITNRLIITSIYHNVSKGQWNYLTSEFHAYIGPTVEIDIR